MRLLVDTNVFLDLFLKRTNSDIARTFFNNAFKAHSTILVSSMSLRDIEYAAHSFFHSKQDSRDVLLKTYQICDKVVSLSADSAITSIYSDSKDYEDSLIMETANQEMADLIITNNLKDFTDSPVIAISPAMFNEYVRDLGVNN